MARGRLMLLSLFFILTYIIVVARVVDLTIIQGEMKKNEETVSYLEAEPVQEKKIRRADILDRNGVILARSLKTASLYADPKLIQDPKIIAKDLVKNIPRIVLWRCFLKTQLQQTLRLDQTQHDAGRSI